MPNHINDTELVLKKLEFEHLKHINDIEIRKRELELKIKEQERSIWKSPLFLAVIAGIVGLFSNAIVALINGYSQRTLEKEKATSAITLDLQKAEGDRILEALKTGDPDKAAANLDLMVKTNLITTGAEQIQQYLRTRKAGEGASLPIPGVSISGRKGSVVGSDDRIIVGDVSQQPFNSICKIALGGGSVTGFFIHPRIVLLPDYAIDDKSDLEGVVVYPASSTIISTSLKVSDGLKPLDLIQSSKKSGKYSYSYLVLPKHELNVGHSFKLPDKKFTNELLETFILHFGGFPGDKPGLIYNSGKSVGVDGDLLYHLLDTGYGAGGGPIWIKQNETYVVVAIHSSLGGENDPGKIAILLNPEEIRSIIDVHTR